MLTRQPPPAWASRLTPARFDEALSRPLPAPGPSDARQHRDLAPLGNRVLSPLILLTNVYLQITCYRFGKIFSINYAFNRYFDTFQVIH